MRGNSKIARLEIANGPSEDFSDDGGDDVDVGSHASSDSSNSLLLRTSGTAAGTRSSSHPSRRGGDPGRPSPPSSRRQHPPRGVARSPHYFGYWLRNHATLALRLAVAAVAVIAIVSVRRRPFLGWDGDHRPPFSSSTAVHDGAKGRAKERESGPPDLHTLIGDFESNVRGNVSFLMDFAIIGHSKCATTTQQTWLRRHPEILMHDHEVHSLKNGRPAELVSLLYALSPTTGTSSAGPVPRRGYKAPNDIRSPDALRSIRSYWPDARLVIGVRHPVKWFESYYNYNTRQSDLGKNGSHRFGPADVMNVPDHAQFHLHLSQLGKTRVLDPGEQELLGPRVAVQPAAMRNKVFLYEVSQPFDAREGRDERYRNDLQHFLGLSTPLEPIAVRDKRGGNYHYAIDICDRRYKYLRHRLVEDGTAAAEWIVRYFLPHPDVTVSSPDRFREILQSWSTDPCAPP